MKKLNIQIVLVALLVGLIFACKGPAGETGPQGDTGAQGATGAAGAPGAKGEKGDPGTGGGSANTTTTPWITVKSTDWQLDPQSDSTYYEVNFIDKGITQAVFDKGAIFCFAKTSTQVPVLFALPYNSGRYSLEFIPLISTTEGGIMSLAIIGFNKLKISNDWAFRWVIISDLTVRNGRLKNINWKNYEEVKEVLDLKD